MKSKKRSIFVRSEQSDRYLPCRDVSAFAGIAIAGCAITGNTNKTTEDTPQGTFNIGDTIG